MHNMDEVPAEFGTTAGCSWCGSVYVEAERIGEVHAAVRCAEGHLTYLLASTQAVGEFVIQHDIDKDACRVAWVWECDE